MRCDIQQTVYKISTNFLIKYNIYFLNKHIKINEKKLLKSIFYYKFFKSRQQRVILSITHYIITTLNIQYSTFFNNNKKKIWRYYSSWLKAPPHKLW